MTNIFSQEDWIFLDPQSVAVLTSVKILSGEHPILYVCHDDDDGMWQFHTGADVDEEDARIVALSEIVKRDLSIFGLADLPMGWIATRKSQNDNWQRSEDLRVVANF
jgi:hypothetical protein